MGGILLTIIGIAFVVIWIKSLVDYDGSQLTSVRTATRHDARFHVKRICVND